MRGESPQHVAADPVFRGICPVFWVVAFGVEILYCSDAFSGDFWVVELLVHFDAVFEVYEAVGDSFFAFRDEESDGSFAVVYRRYDGDYGLIEDAK